MKRIIFIIIWVTIAANIFAYAMENIEYTCPLCKTKIEFHRQISYRILGQNLDFRHYGDAIFPLPIPKCHNCSFVFIDELFAEEEIDKLNKELTKDNIFEKEPDMPNYYYLAREAGIVERSLDDISWWLLSSVWENKDESKKNQLPTK
jgi:uncharacterized protein (DUF2225 family)